MTAVQDTYPPLRQKKVFVVLTVSVIGYLGGLIVCTEASVDCLSDGCHWLAVFICTVGRVGKSIYLSIYNWVALLLSETIYCIVGGKTKDHKNKTMVCIISSSLHHHRIF